MINKLVEKIKKTQAPIVVGLDPSMKFVPEQIQKRAFAEYGETMKGAAEAIWQYNKASVDAVSSLALRDWPRFRKRWNTADRRI